MKPAKAFFEDIKALIRSEALADRGARNSGESIPERKLRSRRLRN